MKNKADDVGFPFVTGENIAGAKQLVGKAGRFDRLNIYILLRIWVHDFPFFTTVSFSLTQTQTDQGKRQDSHGALALDSTLICPRTIRACSRLGARPILSSWV